MESCCLFPCVKVKFLTVNYFYRSGETTSCRGTLLTTEEWNTSTCPAKTSGCPTLSCTTSKFHLNGLCHEIFCFRFFSWISFPPAQEYPIRTVLNFFKNSGIYSQVKVHHRYQRHRRQILPPVLLVSLIPVANLLPVSTIPMANLILMKLPRSCNLIFFSVMLLPEAVFKLSDNKRYWGSILRLSWSRMILTTLKVLFWRRLEVVWFCSSWRFYSEAVSKLYDSK